MISIVTFPFWTRLWSRDIVMVWRLSSSSIFCHKKSESTWPTLFLLDINHVYDHTLIKFKYEVLLLKLKVIWGDCFLLLERRTLEHPPFILFLYFGHYFASNVQRWSNRVISEIYFCHIEDHTWQKPYIQYYALSKFKYGVIALKLLCLFLHSIAFEINQRRLSRFSILTL